MDEKTVELKGFSFYRSYFEAAKELPKEQQAEFLMAICSYVFDGEEPDIHGIAAAMFKLAKPNLETSIKRAKAGSVKSNDNKTEIKSETKPNQIKSNENQNKSNDNQMIIKTETIKDIGYRIKDKDKEEDKDLGEKEKNTKEKPPKHKYGQYQNVLLSDIEMQKLQEEFPFDWEERIEKVSEYVASKGAKYKDFLATIRSWARRDKVTRKTIPKPSGKNDIEYGVALMNSILEGEANGSS